ncbi:MAG: pH regulation protein F [Candidatus Altiarchaeota archaeon]|nr:pH regulation protein F [Candidatus Altiarchaeota archaeon]
MDLSEVITLLFQALPEVITLLFQIIPLFLVFTAFLCLYRVVIGPRAGNRIIAINVIGTKTVVLLVLVGFIYGSPYFVDVALVYALVNFIMTLAVAKYLETGGI